MPDINCFEANPIEVSADTAVRLSRAATDAGRAIRRLEPGRAPLEDRIVELIERSAPPEHGS